MLIGFSVSNYKSFNTSQSISLQASEILHHKSHLKTIGSKQILKCSLIFGANASGKSNLINAMDFSRNIIINGLDSVELNKKYFRLNNDTYKLPAVFEYRLIVNEIEYSYGIVISYAQKNIISEWLIRIDNDGKETCIYNRDVDENGKYIAISEYDFDNTEDELHMKIYLKDFSENISDTFKKTF